MEIIQALLSIPFLFAALLVAALTKFIRTIIEFIIQSPRIPFEKTNHVYRKLFLPLLPLSIGLLIAFSGVPYPYPQDFSSTLAKAAFWLSSSLLSSLVYNLIKDNVMRKINENK